VCIFQAESSCDSSSEGCHSDGDSSEQDSRGNGILDLEELGTFSSSLLAARERKSEDNSPKEMVTASLKENLTKQGYRIVGTHSGVKLCRWTKVLMGMSCRGEHNPRVRLVVSSARALHEMRGLA
jgi:tRNA wybutosine-synthesizing protein 1